MLPQRALKCSHACARIPARASSIASMSLAGPRSPRYRLQIELHFRLFTDRFIDCHSGSSPHSLDFSFIGDLSIWLSAYFVSGSGTTSQFPIFSRFCMARCGSQLPMLVPVLPAAKAGLDECQRGAWWAGSGQVTHPHRRCMHPDHSCSDPMTAAAPSLRTHGPLAQVNGASTVRAGARSGIQVFVGNTRRPPPRRIGHLLH